MAAVGSVVLTPVRRAVTLMFMQMRIIAKRRRGNIIGDGAERLVFLSWESLIWHYRSRELSDAAQVR